MKILKRPKIKPVTCMTCGAVFQPKFRNLVRNPLTLVIKDSVQCPFCDMMMTAEFVDKEKDNG